MPKADLLVSSTGPMQVRCDSCGVLIVEGGGPDVRLYLRTIEALRSIHTRDCGKGPGS
jgi:ribosomal protein S27E